MTMTESHPTQPPSSPAETAPESNCRSIPIVEAVLFASDSPLSAGKIAQAGELSGPSEVRRAVEALNERYEANGAAFRIEAIAGGYQMLTLPQYHGVLGRLLRTKAETKLSQAALETLSIVAYRQPILRADVEAIRGVSCGEVLRSLMDKQLLRIVGRAEVLGRPMLYGTTKRFLEVFGLARLDDLPKAGELRQPAGEAPSGPAPEQSGQSDSHPSEDETPSAEQPTAEKDAQPDTPAE